jgi:hypothetical protein
MKNPQTIFHKDGIWITDKENALKAIREARAALRLADFNIDQFGLRGMGVLPEGKAYRSVAVKLWEVREALAEYEADLLEMDIRDGIPDPRETSMPIPEIAD